MYTDNRHDRFTYIIHLDLKWKSALDLIFGAVITDEIHTIFFLLSYVFYGFLLRCSTDVQCFNILYLPYMPFFVAII